MCNPVVPKCLCSNGICQEYKKKKKKKKTVDDCDTDGVPAKKAESWCKYVSTREGAYPHPVMLFVKCATRILVYHTEGKSMRASDRSVRHKCTQEVKKYAPPMTAVTLSQPSIFVNTLSYQLSHLPVASFKITTEA